MTFLLLFLFDCKLIDLIILSCCKTNFARPKDWARLRTFARPSAPDRARNFTFKIRMRRKKFVHPWLYPALVSS